MNNDDREACLALIRRSARLVDQGRAEEFGLCFTPDASLTRPNGQTLAGRAQIVDSYSRRDPGRVTVHVVGDIDLQLAGPGVVHAASTVLVYQGSTASRKPQTQAVGSFDDMLVEQDGAWLIKARQAGFVFQWDVP